MESYCNDNENIALSLDIANQEKHVSLSRNRSNKIIGIINTHLHLFSPDGKDRTELTIEINNEKKDLKEIAKMVLQKWEEFFKEHLPQK